jgi:hypothetical protein
VPTIVFYKSTGGTWKELLQKPLREMIFIEGENEYLKDKTGDPSMYAVEGTDIVFNKCFNRTDTAAVKVYGLTIPTDLTVDGSTSQLPADYDMLTVYESARLWYQRDDDSENQGKFEALALRERTDLRLYLNPNDLPCVQLDPYVYGVSYTNIANPNVFFSS